MEPTDTLTPEAVETPENGGKNTDKPEGGAETPSASGAPAAPATNGETPKPVVPQPQPEARPESATTNGFKPITSQAEFDAAVKERMERSRKAEERKRQEEKGEWEKLYSESKQENERLQKEIERRDQEAASAAKEAERQKLVAAVQAKYSLPREIAELLKGETQAEMEEHAKTLSGVVGTPVVPPTENGAQVPVVPAKGAGAEKKNFSFNVPNGVKW